MELGALIAAIDDLVVCDAAALADGDTLVELRRQLSRLEATTALATAAFDAGGEWAADGAKTSTAWLARHWSVPADDARHRLAQGRALRHLPVAEAAWLSGAITSHHVDALARARQPGTEEVMARDEEMLVGEAKGQRFSSFRKILAYWLLRADPEGSNQGAEAKQAKRALHLSQSVDDMWFGDITLDPIAGEIVSAELGRLADELFGAEWAEAKARLGREPTVADLARTPAQRRADALVEMARRSASTPAGSRRPEPLFTVLVGYETFAGMLCELESGTVVAPGALVPWLVDGWIERIVFDGPSRVLDVGVERRLFEGATRRAIEVRDRKCFHDLCEVTARRCQGDHRKPWSKGGLTRQENGRMACGFHNRLRNESDGPAP